MIGATTGNASARSPAGSILLGAGAAGSIIPLAAVAPHVQRIVHHPKPTISPNNQPTQIEKKLGKNN